MPVLVFDFLVNSLRRFWRRSRPRPLQSVGPKPCARRGGATPSLPCLFCMGTALFPGDHHAWRALPPFDGRSGRPPCNPYSSESRQGACPRHAGEKQRCPRFSGHPRLVRALDPSTANKHGTHARDRTTQTLGPLLRRARAGGPSSRRRGRLSRPPRHCCHTRQGS